VNSKKEKILEKLRLKKLRQGKFPEWEELERYVHSPVTETIFEFFRKCMCKEVYVKLEDEYSEKYLSYEKPLNYYGLFLEKRKYELQANLISPNKVTFIIKFTLDKRRPYEEIMDLEPYEYEFVLSAKINDKTESPLFRIYYIYREDKPKYNNKFIEKLCESGRIPTVEQTEKFVLKNKELEDEFRNKKESYTALWEKKRELYREIFGV
jgi:hypothetical protein